MISVSTIMTGGIPARPRRSRFSNNTGRIRLTDCQELRGYSSSIATEVLTSFFIDCRYYRDPKKEPDHPEKTFLGKEQREWLQQSLKDSEAPFKVLISGSGWSKAKGPGGDSWASYLHERNALFDFIRDNQINGVILLSGDTHTGELNAIPWSEKGGYDFYDLVSSPLGQTPWPANPTRKPEIRIRPVFTREDHFGLLEFDLTGEPALRFNLIGTSGREAWKPFVIRADELVNGVVSWKDKIAK